MAQGEMERLFHFWTEEVGLDREQVRDSMRRAAEGHDLWKEREARTAEPLRECIGAVEARFGTVDRDIREVLENLGPSGLQLVTRCVAGCATREELWSLLDLVKETVIEGKLRGGRQVLRGLLERRFGRRTDEMSRWSLAIDLADAYALNGCFERLLEATSAEEVTNPLLADHGLQ